MIRDAEAHAEEAHKLRELADARNLAENLAYQTEKIAQGAPRQARGGRGRDDRGPDHGAPRRPRLAGRERDPAEDRGAAARPRRSWPRPSTRRRPRSRPRVHRAATAPLPRRTRSSRMPTTRWSTRENRGGQDLMATPTPISHLRRAAKRRHVSSSVAPVAYGYERSLRPSLACFSLPESTTSSAGDRL